MEVSQFPRLSIVNKDIFTCFRLMCLFKLSSKIINSFLTQYSVFVLIEPVTYSTIHVVLWKHCFGITQKIIIDNNNNSKYLYSAAYGTVLGLKIPEYL